MRDELKNLLEIYLITYNRDSKLKNTLQQIFSEKSPIRDFEIKLIDNKSTDKTAEVVKTFQEKFPNLKYEKNLHNIGGNANITKAYYSATKKYVWVLADNDDFVWDSWTEVVDAINADKDAIMVSNYEKPQADVAQFFIQTTFVPGMIYKTSLIDNDVIMNMAFNISNMFPHLALSSKLINENLDVHILQNPIIEFGDNTDEATGEYKYTRGQRSDIVHPLMADMNWITGFANSLYMIKDKKVRSYIATHNKFYISELNSAKLFFFNAKNSNGSLYNLLSIFCVLDIPNKLRFLFNWLGYYTIYRIIYFYTEYQRSKNKEDKFYYKLFRVRLLGLVRIKLLKLKIRG